MPFHYLPLFTRVYLICVAEVLGAVLASFTGCVVWRTLRHESALKGRSHCDACGHVLGPADLVPIFSYLLLHGRCRYCRSKLSPISPITEAILAVFFGIFLWRFGISAQFVVAALLAVLLLAGALWDLWSYTLPDALHVLIILLFLADIPATGGGPFALVTGLISALLCSVPILILSLIMDHILKKESMGGGDIKLLFACGLYLTPRTCLFFLLLSCLLGIAFFFLRALTLPEPEEEVEAPDQTPDDIPEGGMPFGPSIALAAAFSLAFAEPAVAAYLSLFGL